MIAPALSELVHPIGEFKPHPDNPRRGKVERIRESLERFGQMKPIVVQRSTGFIVARNHVWRAAKSLGWTEIAASVADLTDTQAKAFLIADNRAADLGDYDDAAVLALLESLDSTLGTGYDDADVEELQRRLEADSVEAEPRGEEATSNREIVLTMGETSHAAYLARIEKLRTAYRLDTAAAVVYEAVRREWKASTTRPHPGVEKPDDSAPG